MIAGYTYSHALDQVGANWDFGAGLGLPSDSTHPERSMPVATSIFVIASLFRMTYLLPGKKKLRPIAERMAAQLNHHVADGPTVRRDGCGNRRQLDGRVAMIAGTSMATRRISNRHRSEFRSSQAAGDPAKSKPMPPAMRSRWLLMAGRLDCRLPRWQRSVVTRTATPS